VANLSLFQSLVGRLIRPADAVNAEGAPAYRMTPKQALAQLAMTACLNNTFYASDEQQLETVLALCAEVEPAFIARVAVYARRVGTMKDLPALLCAVLAVRDSALMVKVFSRVIDSPRMLRTFVQIVRSGRTGRKSFGTRVRRVIREWLDARSDQDVFLGSVGTRPSLADIVKMVHPRPRTPGRAALYRYLLGGRVDVEALPPVVGELEAFRRDPSQPIPDVPFQLLTACPLTTEHWTRIAERASLQTLRMNLNTFARHGVFDVPGMAASVTARLRDRNAIRAARVLPYQLMVAHAGSTEGVPREVREALQDAIEVAMENVPAVAGQVIVCPDLSGSMLSPLTGRRKGATTVVRCVDVAALAAAGILRANPSARVLPFSDGIVRVQLDARDTITTNARRLAEKAGGGTNCSAPLARLNREHAMVDLVILVSDNQSWRDVCAGPGTKLMHEWERLRGRCPRARLVCVDLQPYTDTQAHGREEILNVGGFSDGVFELIGRFVRDGGSADAWVDEIEGVAV
jgi:60 kDa SS-A/Ro ribonucleoprotein